jgi:eukaryotic-like serine/threonine-protein kinase
MGEVYRAQDTKLKRTVALKRLAPKLQADSNYRHRFLQEAERASRFTDAHVAALYDVLEERGEIFLVMEYVEGETLRQRMRRPMTLDQFFEMASQCAEALASAHDRGIVHCDIKPENIMITTGGQVKILDFGVAKYLPRSDQSSTVDQAGTMAGTPAYMSPEVLLEKVPDGRADVFSLGVVFYEMLTGHHPFLASSFMATTDRIRKETPAPIRIFNRRVPEGLEVLVSKALAKEAGQRYASARELLEDLRLVQAGLTPTRLQPVLPLAQTRKRPRWLIPFVVLALVAATVLVMYRRAHTTPILAERGWVLIADFDSRGDNPIPDAGIREGLAIALQQSRYVNVFPRTRTYEVLQRMEKQDAPRIDETLGREICRRENLQVLLAGSIEHVGQSFQITVRAIDPVNGNLLFAEQERMDRREQFFDKADELSNRVRKDLGESLAGIETNSRPLAKVTTASLQALQLYSRASDAVIEGKVDQAPPLLQATLQLDPDFAMAHRLLATVDLINGNRGKQLEHLTRAYDLRQEVTDRERRLIEADYYGARGEYEKSVQSLLALVGLYPDDAEAHEQLALAYASVDDYSNAIQQLRGVLKLDPESALPHANLVRYLARSNENDQAIAAFQEATTRGLKTPGLSWGLGLALLGQGNVAAARREFSRVQESGGAYQSVGRVYLARTLIYEGKMADAVDLLNTEVRLDQSLSNRSPELLSRYLLASIFLLQGKRDMAAVQLRQMLGAGEPESVQAEDLRRVGTLDARMGDIRSAREILRKLEGLSAAVPTAFNRSCYDNVAGEVALAEGNTKQAADMFSAALAVYPRFMSHEGLAHAYQAEQDLSRSAAEWNQVLQAKGEILQDASPADWLTAHLQLARVYRHSGDLAQARDHYQQFLSAWREGNDLPVRRQALRESQELEDTKLEGRK